MAEDGTLSKLEFEACSIQGKEVNMAGDYDDALVCCVENTVEDRIMDSGASFHATYCKEELERFKLRSGKTLKDVRYIPGLKRRLISVGQLDEEGYHCQRLGNMSKIGINMLASKGIVQDIRKAMALHLLHQSEDPATMILLSKTAAGAAFGVAERLSQTFRAESMGLYAEAPKIFLTLIRRVTRLSKVEILHLWTRFMEPGGSSDTSEGSENSGSFKDSGRSDKEYFKHEASSKRGRDLRLHRYEDPPESPGLYKESIQWKKAIIEEIVSLEKNQTCSLVRIPTRKKALQRLLMLKVKEEQNNSERGKGSDMAEFNKPKWQLPLVFEMKDIYSKKQVFGYVLTVGVTTVDFNWPLIELITEDGFLPKRGYSQFNDVSSGYLVLKVF
nr:hypothetical protein [Tanacetum cinerariifolium]